MAPRRLEAKGSYDPLPPDYRKYGKTKKDHSGPIGFYYRDPGTVSVPTFLLRPGLMAK